MKDRPLTLLDGILLFILLFCVVVAIQYYYNMEMRDCLSDPLGYASRYYEKEYGYAFSGTGRFMIPESPIIFFDKDGVTAKENP